MQKQHNKRYQNKYGFTYDENQITYSTSIPQLPIKLLKPPNQKQYQEKLKSANLLLKQKRQQRTSNKLILYQAKQQHTQQLLDNIKLAKYCIMVLQKDIQQLINAIDQCYDKKKRINNNNRNIIKNQQKIQKIQKLQDTIRVLKEKKQLKKEKMQSITQSINQFQKNILKYEKQRKNIDIEKNQQLQKKYQQEVFQARFQKEKIQQNYKKQLQQYQHQIQQIKWIKWANQIKQKINQQWKKKKQKEKKYRQGSNQNQQIKNKKIKINKYQNEIDYCSFLINQCKNLLPLNNINGKQSPQPIKQEEIYNNSQSMNGLQYIIPKKLRNKNQQQLNKINKKNKISNKNTQEKQIKVQDNKNIIHNFQTLVIFQKINVIPPLNTQQLQKTIVQLQQKIKYYLEHPEGKVDQNHNKKQTNKRQKKIQKPTINLEDFTAIS